MIISFTPQFIRRYKKQERKIQLDFQEALLFFEKDPFQLSLKTHKLKGFDELWSFRINYSHRVLFYFIGKNEVKLVNIGSHDIYK